MVTRFWPGRADLEPLAPTVFGDEHASEMNMLKQCVSLFLLLLVATAVADSITITREGPCDWICADQADAQLSCHTRVDKAIQACANRSLVDGLEYRVIPSGYSIVATLEDPPAAGSITLNWIPPTHNEDGSLLTDLAGYFIYYEGPENGTILVGPAETSREVQLATPGTYTFSMTAFDAEGVESQRSGERLAEL